MKFAKGFTLIELMVAVAIIAILGAVALIGYQEYTTRAAAADIVSAHHNIRTAVMAQQGQAVQDCDALAAGFDRRLLGNPFATLEYGFVPAAGGYRPVLTVCATAERSPRNVPAAKRAYESLAAMGMVETSGPVLRDVVASFSARLTDGDKAMCEKYTRPTTTTCGQAPAVQPQPAQPAAQPAQAAPAQAPVTPAAAASIPGTRTNQAPPVVLATTATTCPAGQEMVLTNAGGQVQRACGAKCQSGERRDPAGLCIPDIPPPVPAFLTNAVPPADLKLEEPPPPPPGQPMACPAGKELLSTVVGGNVTQRCFAECAKDEERDPDGKCVDPVTKLPHCWDEYGPTCAQDFGDMCSEDYVREMCKQYCSPVATPTSCTPRPPPPPPPPHPAYREGTTPDAPRVRWGMGNFFQLLPRRAGDHLILTEQQILKTVGAYSPGNSLVTVTNIDMGGYSRYWQVTHQDDGNWRITAVTGVPRAQYSGQITVSNGLGTNTVAAYMSGTP